MFYGTMKDLVYEIQKIDDRLSVEVYFKMGENLKEFLGILYFEKAKKAFQRKPIGMDAWACVDAKVEGLYTKDGGITPKQIVKEAYEKIKEAGY